MCFPVVVCLFIYLIIMRPVLVKNNLYEMPQKSVEYFKNYIGNGNVYTHYLWSGFVTWKTDKKAQVFLDTRLEPFSEQILELSDSFYSEPLLSFDEMISVQTEYVLLPIDKTYEQWVKLEELGLADILFVSDISFIVKLNKSPQP